MTTRRLVCGWVMVVTAILLPACAPVARKHAPAGISSRKAPPGPAPEVIAKILRAEDRRRVDPDLLDLLASPSPEVRARAVRAVGRIGDHSFARRLAAALEDGSSLVRSEAVFALALLGRPDDLPALRERAADSDPRVRSAVAFALGWVRDPAGSEMLGKLLSDGDPGVAASACLAVWKMPDASFALDALIEASRSANATVRFAAAYALGRIGAAGLEPAGSGAPPWHPPEEGRARIRKRLAEMATSPGPEVRMQVARGLTIPQTSMEGDVLSRLAADPDPRVRVRVAGAVGYPGAPLEPTLKRLSADGNPGVVRAALDGMARTERPEAEDILIRRIIYDRRTWLRVAAVDALIVANRKTAAFIANGLSREPKPRLRQAAARALLGDIGDRSRGIARRLLEDPDPSVRTAAVPVVATAPGPLGKILETVAASDDPLVRAALARAAGKRLASSDASPEDREDALSLLASVWERSAADEIPEAPLAVVEAAGKAGEGPPAKAILLSALDNRWRQVRLRAVSLLLEVYGEDHADRAGPASDRTPDEYIRIARWAAKPRAAVITVQREQFPPGRFTVWLDTRNAPLTCWNFAQLAEKGFYDGVVVHRVVPAFVMQTGDPRGDGYGGPGYAIRDELSANPFTAGAVGMATDGPDTAGSQWFVTLAAQPHLDARYTLFGRVVQNFPGVVLQVLPDDRVVSVRVYEGNGSEPLPPLRQEGEEPGPSGGR